MEQPVDNVSPIHTNSQWLDDVLEETGLQQFHSKLTNDLQLSRLSHFDFVSEEDLVQIGMSKPAARRLLAAIKKRKSFVTALKNKLINKIISTPNPANLSSLKTRQHRTKPKSKFSKLFGTREPPGSTHNNLSQHPNRAYYRFITEQSASPNLESLMYRQTSPIRSKSIDLIRQQPREKSVDNETPLINLDDEPPAFVPDFSALRCVSPEDQQKQTQNSLIDMDNSDFMMFLRRASDTRLNQADDNYRSSWAGSWNTGTFYGSSNNIYSAYYCPQDAGPAAQTTLVSVPPSAKCAVQNHDNDDSNLYYSVIQ